MKGDQTELRESYETREQDTWYMSTTSVLYLMFLPVLVAHAVQYESSAETSRWFKNFR